MIFKTTHLKLSKLGQFFPSIMKIGTQMDIIWLNLHLHHTPIKKL